jgi:hypothetical protein
MTDDEYGALLRHVYEFCRRAAAGSGNSGDPILHREPPFIKKNRSDATAILNITEGLAYLSLDLIYDLQG